jgi:hypothetical protein
LAGVVEIYKGKGKHTDPKMYRPINLLNTAYNLFARRLQSRLGTALDHKLRATQFGFRQARSYSQPIHIVRRLQEWAERKNTTLYMLFLDWEKAFDKSPQKHTSPHCRDFGVSEAVSRIIPALYREPLFRVKDNQSTSSTRKAGTGIRQGCPLSPYLFLVIHSAIMHDV